MRGHDPFFEKPDVEDKRPASIKSGLADVESITGDREMSPFFGRVEYLSGEQRKRRSVDDILDR